MFFRLGEAKWQHCPTRWMLVTSSSDSSVLDTENGDIYIRRTACDYPIPPLAWHETHRNSSTIEWDMQWWRYGRENVHSWVRQFKAGRTSCVNKPKEPRPRTSRSEDMIARVEQMVMEDRRLTVKEIAANAGISVGSVDTFLHDDLKMRKVSARWVPRMLTEENKASHFAMCQAMLSRDKGMNSAFFS